MGLIFRTLLILCLVAFLLLSTSAIAANGATIYKQRCIQCHGPKGDGKGEIGKFMNPPPANYKVRLKSLSNAQVKQSITNGKGSMPSFKNTLSSQEIDSVIGYIRSLTR